MNQKETFNSAVKHHHLNLLVRFDCRDDLVHLRKHLWTEDVERRMVNRDPPILGRAPRKTDLPSICRRVIPAVHVFVSFVIWGLIWSSVGPFSPSHNSFLTLLYVAAPHIGGRVSDRREVLLCPP